MRSGADSTKLLHRSGPRTSSSDDRTGGMRGLHWRHGRDRRRHWGNLTIAESHAGRREGCELNREKNHFQSRLFNIWNRLLVGLRNLPRLYLKKSSSLPETGNIWAIILFQRELITVSQSIKLKLSMRSQSKRIPASLEPEDAWPPLTSPRSPAISDAGVE